MTVSSTISLTMVVTALRCITDIKDMYGAYDAYMPIVPTMLMMPKGLWLLC